MLPGVSKNGALNRTTEPVTHRKGGNPRTERKSPGQTKYEAITLERGVTHDTEFEKWVNKVWNYGSGLGVEVSLKDFRKDLIIEVYNEAGQLALAYKRCRCWVSEFQALPDLNASANAVAIQTLKLDNEGGRLFKPFLAQTARLFFLFPTRTSWASEHSKPANGRGWTRIQQHGYARRPVVLKGFGRGGKSHHPTGLFLAAEASVGAQAA